MVKMKAADTILPVTSYMEQPVIAAFRRQMTCSEDAMVNDHEGLMIYTRKGRVSDDPIQYVAKIVASKFLR